MPFDVCLLGTAARLREAFWGDVWMESEWWECFCEKEEEGERDHQGSSASGGPFVCQCHFPSLQWQCLFVSLG